MDSIRVFCDSIKAVVNVSCKCAEPQNECPTNWQDVAIVGIIAAASVVIIGFVCWKVCDIIKMKKIEGIKSIVGEIIETKNVKCDVITSIVDNILTKKNVTSDGIKPIVEKILEDKAKLQNNNGKQV